MSAAGAPSGAASELQKRVLSGSVMAAVAVGVTLWGGGPFALVWIAAACCVAYEWQRMALGAEGSRQAVAAIAAVVTAGLWAMGALPVAVGLPAAIVLTGVAAGLSRAEIRAEVATGVLYACALAAAVLLCRSAGRDGAIVIFWLFAVVWGTDILAYFTGRTLGGPKLWPRVSPKKTWSGALGGLVGGVILGCLLLAAAGIGLRWQHVALSIAFSALTQAGDLYESALKRRFGVKDSGSLIPGHGGFMDRLDGFIFAVVFAAGFGALRSGASQAPAGLLLWP